MLGCFGSVGLVCLVFGSDAGDVLAFGSLIVEVHGSSWRRFVLLRAMITVFCVDNLLTDNFDATKAKHVGVDEFIFLMDLGCCVEICFFCNSVCLLLTQ